MAKKVFMWTKNKTLLKTIRENKSYSGYCGLNNGTLVSWASNLIEKGGSSLLDTSIVQGVQSFGVDSTFNKIVGTIHTPKEVKTVAELLKKIKWE